MSKRLTQICLCKQHSADSDPRLFKTKIINRCEPPKLLENPIVLLKCFITSFTPREREAAAATKSLKNGMGYSAIQSTKPQTLGFSLADSPVGLLAWIYEKLVTWTDSYPWTDDEGTLTPTYLSAPGLAEPDFQCSHGSRFIGSRMRGQQRPSGSTTSKRSRARLLSPRRPFRSACPSSQRSQSNCQKRASEPFL
jgi:hypothetical protein